MFTKVFTPTEKSQMNNELAEFMKSNITLIAVFGRESVLIYAADKIFKEHGGN